MIEFHDEAMQLLGFPAGVMVGFTMGMIISGLAILVALAAAWWFDK